MAPAAGDAATSVEVYGFAGWIASGLGFLLFLAWAYIPDDMLHAAGITYHPDKQWAVLIPTWVLCTAVFAAWVYESLNQASVRPFECIHTIRDASSKHYRDLGQCTVVNEAHNQAAVLPLMHIPPSVVSRVLYTGKSVEEALADEDASTGLDAKARPKQD